jgi:hypothetical protein
MQKIHNYNRLLGKGYTSIMADVLNYAADNPEILSSIHKSTVPYQGYTKL